MTMNSGWCRLPSTIFVLVLIMVIPYTIAITTTHHDKPEDAQPVQMAKKVQLGEGLVPILNDSTKLEISERQKRLLPYMTFYLEQDFNRPHGHTPPQQLSVPPVTNYATTGAVKQPTILQQYHNKFTEHTNGISFPTGGKFVQVSSQKVKLTPFLDSNALPGPFLPMRYPPNPAPPTKASQQPPNYSTIYDKLSQLKLQQQYQLAQSYNRHYPQQVLMQHQNSHPTLQQGNYARNPAIVTQPQQIQQVSYIPIREYARVPAANAAYKTTPTKTIVQTYTASSIDIPSNNKDNNDDGGVTAIDGNTASDNEDRYEPPPPLYNLPVKTYNEPVKNYRIHPQPQPATDINVVPEEREQYAQHIGELKKHVLKPVILLRQKQPENVNVKPYLIIQRKPPTQHPPAPQYNIELQIPETIHYKPVKYHEPGTQSGEVGKIIVESVTPKYIDIVPKYGQIKPTLIAITPTFAKPYNKYAASLGESIGVQTAQPIPAPPSPPSPRPEIISYQHPSDFEEESNEGSEQSDYIDTEDIKYQKPKYQQTIEVQYANDDNDDREGNQSQEPVITKSPAVTFVNSHSSADKSNKYITTVKPNYQLPPISPAVTHASIETTKSAIPEYQEGANTLSLILKKLQDTNALPQTLTPENIDNSIRTLVKILSSLKKQSKFQKPILVQDNESTEYEGNNEAGVGLGEVPGTVTQIFPENTPEGGTPGTPGVDYPALSRIPQTSFNCKTQRYKGFFGDPDTNCQVWHYCDLNGGQASFLCPNGTIFSQVALTCDWWYNVKCSNTAQQYVLNERLYKYILPLAPKFPEDYSGPLVDRYLALKFQEMEEKMKKERKHKEPSQENEPTIIKEASISSETTSAVPVQDDADELQRETNKQQQAQDEVHHQTSSPIFVPDESNETEPVSSTET